MTDSAHHSPRRLLYVANEDFAFLRNRLPMARAARKAGYEVHVATRVDKGAMAIEGEGFILHPIPFRRGGLSPFAAVPTILALRRVERKIQPDVVHHAGLQCCVYGAIAALGMRLRQVNAITGLGYIFTSLTWQTRILKRALAWLLPWLLNRKGSAVLVQNPDDQAALIDLGIEQTRMVLIPGSGIDTDAFQPLPEPSGPITFGFAGRLMTDKGIRALVAAQMILRSQGREANLVIAGNPDPANPASVHISEVEEWSRRPGITWLGHINDIVSLWRTCHFAVLPSHREGLPVSLLEAAACGRPMIAADAPGCREIVLDRKTGLLVPIEDPAALAEAISKLAASRELRAEYGQAARQLVVDKLSARIIGRSIVQLYDELTRDRSQTSECPSAETSSLFPLGKILLVTQHYAPSPSTTSRYMTEIARRLARESRVTVITGTSSAAAASLAGPGEPNVIEIKSWWPGKTALLSRSLAAVLFSIQTFMALMKHAREEDVLLCVTTPFTLPYAVTLAARMRGAASAVIIHDLYPDTLVMTGFLGPKSILTRLLRVANGGMFHWLDAIVVIGRDMRRKLFEYRSATPEKISLIPNWVTLPIRYRELDPGNPFRQQCGRRFVVAMSGNTGFTHDPVSVFEAARLLKDDDTIAFLLSGEGVGWDKLKGLHAADPLPNVTLVERVPESELENLLTAANLWIIPYRKNNAGVSVPSRTYNLFAVGRPIVICSDPDAETAILLQEENIGWVTPPEHPAALAHTIRLAAQSADETDEKGKRAARVASRYTRQIALGAYGVLIRSLLARQLAISKGNAQKA